MAIQAFPIMLKVFCVLFLAVFIDLVTLINSFFFFFNVVHVHVYVFERDRGRQRKTEIEENNLRLFFNE